MSTGNRERIRIELERAATELIEERTDGYRERLVSIAMLCIAETQEHDDRRTNINQRFDAHIEELGDSITESTSDETT